MYVAKNVFTELYQLPKNQQRLLSRIVNTWDVSTNIGYTSFERLTPTQLQRNKADLADLVKGGFIKRYPRTKYNQDMRNKLYSHSGLIQFYMVNPLVMRTHNMKPEGMIDIWQLLR